MAKRTELFRLIKALNKSERRYFRMLAEAQGGEKNYLRLFDAISQQEHYDEAELKQQFAGEAFVRQFHVAKHYLRSQILKSLRNYHAGRSKDAEIKDLLREAEILFKKELYDLCHHALVRAEKLARAQEKFPNLVEVLSWRRRLLLATKGSARAKEEVNQLINEEQEVLQRQLHLNQHWQVIVNLFDLFGNPPPDGGDPILQHPVIRDPALADSLQAKVLRAHILYAHSVINSSDVEKARGHINDLIELLEDHPERIMEDPGPYITALNNKVGLLLQTGEWEAIPPLLSRIKQIPTTYKLGVRSPVTVRLMLKTFNVELELYRDSGQYEKGIALVGEVSGFLADKKIEIPQEYYLLFYYQFAYLYFMKGNRSRALFWTNQLLNENFGDLREDIQTYARLLNLVLHFELKNFNVLKYAVTSTRRFLKKKRELRAFEMQLLSFFSKACTSPPAQHPVLLSRLRKELVFEDLPTGPANVLDYFDFWAWIDGQLGSSE